MQTSCHNILLPKRSALLSQQDSVTVKSASFIAELFFLYHYNG